MTVEWITPTMGGVLISVSLVTFIILNGIKFGIGDMLKNVLESAPSVSWNNQVLFLIGTIISPLIFTAIVHPITTEPLPNQPITIAFSGLCVGIGYQLCRGGILSKAILINITNFKVTIISVLLFLFFGEITHFIINV